MTKNSILILLVLLCGTLSACSTVAGAGQDISDTAHWVKHKL